MSNLSPDTVEQISNLLRALLHDWLDDKARCSSTVLPHLYSQEVLMRVAPLLINATVTLAVTAVCRKLRAS